MHANSLRNSFTYKFKCYAGEEPINRWANQMSTLIARMDVELVAPNKPFECDWKHIPLGAADLNFIANSGRHTVLHSPAPTQSYELLYLHEGPMELHHLGQTFHIKEGNLVLVDNHSEWKLQFPTASNCTAMHISKKWIQRWLPHPDDYIATAVHRDSIWGAPLTSTFNAIYRNYQSNIECVNQAVIAENLGTLVSMIFSEAGLENKAHRYHTNLYAKMVQFLHQHYNDEHLTAANTADALKISERQLYTVCKQAGKTFANSLMDIRLEKAKYFLESKNYNAYQICEIAWACGFTNASHFSKRFRNSFQVTPEAYRKHYKLHSN